MSQYTPLYDHLMSCRSREWSTTFKEIESILGFKLPNSAGSHTAWWANDESHSQAKEWLKAGWVTQGLSIPNKSVTFVRKNNGLVKSEKTVIESSKKSHVKNHDVDALSEDEIKEVLDDWLKSNNWNTKIAWGKSQGIDIEAVKNNKRWVIEVKGPGSRQPMRVNYFIGILGETLQRMNDPKAKYSIALPDLKQYRGLWERLPDIAKKRTQISLMLVSCKGKIEEFF